MASTKNLDRDLYERATLPLGWRGKRVFTRAEWAQVIKFLKENPDKTIQNFLVDTEDV